MYCKLLQKGFYGPKFLKSFKIAIIYAEIHLFSS